MNDTSLFPTKIEVTNPFVHKMLKEVEKIKTSTSYGDTRYSDGKHTDWAQKK